MIWFIAGLTLGFVLGVTGIRLAWQDNYIRKLERVSNLAELLMVIRRSENARLQELQKVVGEVGQAVAAIRYRGRRDVH